ncbi:hypothetical protein HHSLTHF2_11110 [Vreelandella venusta]|uniref:Integrase catalytic domain-containing protein n=1 Tax=Halomonas hydrothermalis TaxID=115561 RepID=A0A6F8U229_9GAMM|nr:hypothetical protein HHSLTHF2_11110 [Halomonas hydrothermalis]
MTTERCTSGEELEQALQRYAWLYNHHISLYWLHFQSPNEVMLESQTKRPALSPKRVANHLGY